MLSWVVSSAVPKIPSAPGPLTCLARVSTMKLVGLPATYSGSSGNKGTYTVPLPPLVTKSRPWSKNCPKIVIQLLKEGDRPMSGERFSISMVPLSLTTRPAWFSSVFSAAKAVVWALVASMYCCWALDRRDESAPAARMAAAADLIRKLAY